MSIKEFPPEGVVQFTAFDDAPTFVLLNVSVTPEYVALGFGIEIH